MSESRSRFASVYRKRGLASAKRRRMVQEMIEAADREPLGVIGRDGKPSRPRKGADASTSGGFGAGDSRWPWARG